MPGLRGRRRSWLQKKNMREFFSVLELFCIMLVIMHIC
jgi:hypothetical protein